MKALKLLLAVVLCIVALAPSGVAAEQQSSVEFEPAESPDDTCDLRINFGGPFEVTVDGGESAFFPDGSVVPVPQGSSVFYLPQERTFGSTAIGPLEMCETFVPAPGSSSGIGAPLIAGAVVVGLVVLGAVWWFPRQSKRSANE